MIYFYITWFIFMLYVMYDIYWTQHSRSSNLSDGSPEDDNASSSHLPIKADMNVSRFQRAANPKGLNA